MRTMPTWFRVVAAVLILLNLMGAYACIQQFRLGAAAYGPPTDYDVRLFASLPAWYDWVFAFVEVTGVAGTIALFLGRRVALPLLVASVVGIVVQFGYLFATSDIVAVKGVSTTYFPAFIFAVGIVQVWLARAGTRRGWLA